MRLRILTRPSGTLEGVSLDDFCIGDVYDVGLRVGAAFVAGGWAERVADDAHVVVTPTPAQLAALPPLVLVVDDEPEERWGTQLCLAAHGYHVVVAGHGAEALQCLQEQCPDLIVLDLHMPVMNGWQFRAAQQQLADASRASVPILIMTGEVDAAAQADMLRAVGVLEKPFRLDDLLGAVSAAIGRPASRGEAA